MKITYRIPLQTPYAYLEATRDTEVDAEMEDADYAELATDALRMDEAIVSILGDTRPFAVPPAARAAPPPVMPVPQRRQQTTGYTPPAQAQQGCPQCGGALGPVKQTSKGAVRDCAQQNGVCQNERGYPTSVWMTQGGRR